VEGLARREVGVLAGPLPGLCVAVDALQLLQALDVRGGDQALLAQPVEELPQLGELVALGVLQDAPRLGAGRLLKIAGADADDSADLHGSLPNWDPDVSGRPPSPWSPSVERSDLGYTPVPVIPASASAAPPLL
jgi:hypothetical protein